MFEADYDIKIVLCRAQEKKNNMLQAIKCMFFLMKKEILATDNRKAIRLYSIKMKKKICKKLS